MSDRGTAARSRSRSGTRTGPGSSTGTGGGATTSGRTRWGTRTRSAASGRGETGHTTTGLTNARTRLVGARTGVFADAVVTLVRFASAARHGSARALRRVSSVVTPFGWTLLAVTPLCFAIGYGAGWLELVVIGWAALVLLAVAALYLLGASGLDVRIALPHARVVAGERAEGVLIAANPRRRRSFGGLVEVPIGDGLAEAQLPGIAAGAEHRSAFQVPALRRGVVAVGPARTVRADPVGLVRREIVFAGAVTLYVHPRTIGIPSTSTGFIRDLEGNATRELSSDDVSFHALREYVPGDERRYIHWRSSARTGVTMVRQFEQTRRSHLVVALSVAASDYADEEEFELAVGIAGSLGVRAIRDARDVSVVVGATTPAFAKRKVFEVLRLSTLTRARLLDELAGVRTAESALATIDLARVTAGRIGGVSVAFLICGSTPVPAELRAASAQFPPGVEVVAVQCDPETVPGLRRVAGLSVITVGSLEDLQTALARTREL